MMHGRRLSEGLHQAIEAKDGVDIQPENQTLASVTIQNYFRLYEKLSGMTGTAATEAQEFFDIYKMDVSEIPTNRPVMRRDEDDEVYRTAQEKNDAICQQIAECHVRKQPILVGTVSIEKSELLSEMLQHRRYEVVLSRTLKAKYEKTDAKELAKLGDDAYDIEKVTGKGIPHNVLNARYHEQEAYIIADAGVPGTVTIATNMAGRGTDIKLGGNLDMRLHRWRDEQRGLGIEPTEEAEAEQRTAIESEINERKQEALAAGGLFVLGTERHESRRIDNQLRGRTGRQGDPGRSKFFLSCEDDLLRIFAGDRLDAIMRTFGVEEGEAITHRWLNGAIATAQKRVEQRNYEIRKNLLKYDDVVNDQRKAVFEQRHEFMVAEDLSEVIVEMRNDTIEDIVARHLPPKAYADQWDVDGLAEQAEALLGLQVPMKDWAAEEGIANDEIVKRLTEAADQRAAERESLISAEQTRQVEKNFLLQMTDMQWREHLLHLDHLRNVIGLRGYGQRDPLNEYKSEAFSLFETLIANLRQSVTRWTMTVEFRFAPPEPSPPPMYEIHMNPETGDNERALESVGATLAGGQAQARAALPLAALPPGFEATGRNQPCPCGSGKKFKHCHGALV
jgi:preprotein translocase subunit SecA